MPAHDPVDRFMAASIAANTRWAHEPNRAAATLPARVAFEQRFEDEVDPDRTLPPEECQLRAKAARQAYFVRLALRSAQARRKTVSAA